MEGDYYDKGKTCLSSKGEEGKLTGGNYNCRLEGCNGLRVGVRWPDGKTTFPCTKGMDYRDGKWVIPC